MQSQVSDRIRRTSAGFTGIELFWGIFWLGCGIAGALVLAEYVGAIGYPIGFVSGIAVSYGGPRLVIAGLDWWIPEYPPCRCGHSGKSNYKFEGWRHGSQLLTCRNCGRQYLKKVRSFLQVNPDGVARPYLMHRPFGRWQHVSETN